MVCRAVSVSYTNAEIPTSEWPFLPNCFIVLVGQAGGSKPHLASGGNKKKKTCISTQHRVWECWGMVAALDIFILKATHPPLAVFKSFGLDLEKLCAAIVSDVLC